MPHTTEQYAPMVICLIAAELLAMQKRMADLQKLLSQQNGVAIGKHRGSNIFRIPTCPMYFFHLPNHDTILNVIHRNKVTILNNVKGGNLKLQPFLCLINSVFLSHVCNFVFFGRWFI